MLDKSVKSAEGAAQVIKAGRRDEFFVDTNEACRLCITQIQLEVDDLISCNSKISGHQICEGCKVLLVDAELVISDRFNTTLE